MTRIHLNAFVAMLFSTASLLAQGPTFTGPPPALLGPPPFANEQLSPFVTIGSERGTPKPTRAWVSMDYLHWWVNGGPVGVPLVTTGNPASPTAGAIGDSSTQVLFGNNDFDYGGFHGGRVSLGRWFGADARVGIEASGFLLNSRSASFNATSNSEGSPLLALPFQTPAGVEARQLVSTPLPARLPTAGSIDISSTSQLWGADVNGVVNIYRGCYLSVDLLGGFRYYDLDENLRIDARSTFNVRNPIPGANVFFVPATISVFDQFSTRNQFYGGQIGTRTTLRAGRFSADILGFFAIGSTQHTLNTNGATSVSVNGAPLAAPAGGFYTKPSNIGNYRSSSLSIAPQTQIKLGYDITDNLRATIGYDLLYWTNVNRPGNQIDRVIGPQPGTRPAPQDNHSTLWVHGINAGLEYRW